MSKNSLKSTVECFRSWRSSMNIVIKPKKNDEVKEYQSLEIFKQTSNQKNK